MNHFQKVRPKFDALKTNTKLVLKAEHLLFRNRGYLVEGDSIPVLKTKRLIEQSTLPQRLRQRYRSKLGFLFGRHLANGKMWIEFRELLAEKEKKENRKLSQEEKEALWRRYNKDMDGY